MEKSTYLILQNIRSLYNVGAIFRSADAFGIDKIFLCGLTAYPPKRQLEKIAKTALGAEKNIPWEHYRQTATLIKKLKKENIQIISLELTKNSTPLKNFKLKRPIALIVGNEVKGIPKNILKLSDKIIYIPMQGKKESLNVAIAASIAMYELSVKK